jgi:hypothetical protein
MRLLSGGWAIFNWRAASLIEPCSMTLQKYFMRFKSI